MQKFKNGMGGAVRIGKRQVYRSLGRYRYRQDGSPAKWAQQDAAEDVPAEVADIDITERIKEIRDMPWDWIKPRNMSTAHSPVWEAGELLWWVLGNAPVNQTSPTTCNFGVSNKGDLT